ncbi:MAG: hypothetical protein FRX48_00051 [Lasallia pustulata]|uniref:Uncharacterized protein n=1 Tax=Lasallia pustulata TaxID=136370 RepID=A0A5M8PZQ8_9LECA|nr:MAG: hypothetical protein FRX48_00051 [Lasallia pustulata]
MIFYLEKAERHLPEWELDLVRTSYPTDIKDFWAEQQLALEAQRSELRRVVAEAENTTKSTEAFLQTFRGELAKPEAERIDVQLQTMKQVLSETSDDLDAVQSAQEHLHKLSTPLRNLATHAQKALIKDAHAIVYSAEKHILAVDESDTRQFTTVQRVRSKLEALRELVAAEPEQSQKIKKAMEEVRNASQDLEDILKRTDSKEGETSAR